MNNVTIDSLLQEVYPLPTHEQHNVVGQLVVHTDSAYRMRALAVASAIGHPSVREFCLQLLSDPVWYVRCSACEFAYLNSVGECVDNIIWILENDPNEFVRSYAALSLAHIGRAEHLSRLETLLDRVTGYNHEDVPVRDILQRSIDRIKDS